VSVTSPGSVAVRKGRHDDWGLRYVGRSSRHCLRAARRAERLAGGAVARFPYDVRCYDEVLVAFSYVRRRRSATRLVGKQPGEAA
jgi:hypothetical protein